MKNLCLLFALCAGNFSVFSFESESDFEDLTQALGFEANSEVVSLEYWEEGGWRCYPGGCAFLDDEISSMGTRSARIEMPSAGTDEVVVYKEIPFKYDAEGLMLMASLYGEEGNSGYIDVAFLDSSKTSIDYNKGERFDLDPDVWTLKTYEAEIPPDTESVRILIHSTSKSKLWVDCVEVVADGIPLHELEKKTTILDRDHEFDDGSGISLTEVTPLQIEALERLCLIWGFLKYHHPAVKGGEYHWDYELFRVLPSILACKTEAEIQQRLYDWVSRFDVPVVDAEVEFKKVDIHFSADLGWMQDTGFLENETVEVLKRVYEARNKEKRSFYCQLQSGKYPLFANELPYKNMDVRDAGYRLLSLFRYWNLVQYWFPYRNLIKPNWGEALGSSISSFVTVHNRKDYLQALAILIAKVQDSHASFMHIVLPSGKGSYRLNAIVEHVEDAWVVTGYEFDDESMDLLVGDIIQQIDGTPIDEIVERLARFCSASNPSVRFRDVGRYIPLGCDGKSEITVIRNGEITKVDTIRMKMKTWPKYQFHSRHNEVIELLHPELAYLNMARVETDEVESYVNAMMGKRGVVIDIRNYPSAHLVHSLAGHLVQEDTDFARFTFVDTDNPGQFIFTEKDVSPAQTPYYSGKIVVLVDELSQSNAEYQTMAFQAGANTIVMGSQTAGADGNVAPFTLPGNVRAMFTGIGVFYPDKSQTQQIGIVPDIEVKPTIEGIKARRDEVLEAALKEILGDSVSEAEIREIAMRN